MYYKILTIIAILTMSVQTWSHEKKDSDLNVAINVQNAFAKVTEKALPAVVIVKTAKKIKQYYYIYPKNHNNHFFNYHFFHRDGRILETESTPIPSGQASGFIFHENGYILTNYHVVQDQSDFKIVLHNKKEYAAKIIGVDPETDLAVLKIDTDEKLPFLKFADPETVKVGHYAIAIGAPFGLEHTVTTGTVSFKGRTSDTNLSQNYIQTDVAINPGNSGGPLLNLYGEVIGINNFIMTPPGSQGNIGLAFAISCKVAKKISSQLMITGKAERAWLGIATREILPQKKSKVNKSNGLMLVGIYQGGSADQAGLRLKDIITKIANNEVKEPEDIQKIIVHYIPGDVVDLEIIRDGVKKILKVKLEARPDSNRLNF